MQGKMRQNIVRITVASIAAVGLMAVSACGAKSGNSTKKESATTKISVVASINQWGSLAAELGGTHVQVTSIMTNTNVEAHDYEPTAKDIATISKAKIAIINGADYDPWASKALQGTSVKVVDAAKTAGIHEGDNPHVWFSSKVRTAAADALTDLFASEDAAHKDDYTKLNKAWHDREDKLETAIAKARSTTANKPYAATESVAKYLADDLQLEDKTPEGYLAASANESEPSPSDIKQFQDLLTAKGISLLFYNTQEADNETEEIVKTAKANSITIIEITEQMPEQYNTLIEWMQDLVNRITA